MKRFAQLSLFILVIGYFGACADMNFDKIRNCQSSGLVCELKCQGDECYEVFDHSITTSKGMVDIVFINDNSGSMSTEQAKMAERFPHFFDKIEHLDYQIAMITTDVGTPPHRESIPKPGNGYGKFQDGKPLEFVYSNGAGSGTYILRPDTPNKEELFKATVKRQETLDCEASNYDNKGATNEFCASGDERGVYAAHMLTERNDHNIFRPTAHAAFIILADEDERSATKISGNMIVADTNNNGNRPLETKDIPQNLIQTFNKRYPSKTLSAHSIIIRPGDTSCFNTQNDEANHIYAYYGYLYANFSNLTGGHIGNICAPDYTNEMGAIGSKVAEQVSSIALACNPRFGDLKIEFTPDPNPPVQIIEEFDKRRVRFNPALPENTKVRLQYSCDA